MASMTDDNIKWWKGSFPMWIASALLGICCWLGKHGLATIEEELRTNRDLITKLDASQGTQDIRIVTLETQVRDMREVFAEMRSDFRIVKDAQIGVLSELKKMGVQLESLKSK